MRFQQRFTTTLLLLLCCGLRTGVAWGRMGLLGHCDFAINQIQLSPEDFQFYSDWPSPPSWIACGGQPISSHPETRHFWLFLQLGSDELAAASMQAAELRRELGSIAAQAEGLEGDQLPARRTEELLNAFADDVAAKGKYLEVIVIYDPQVPVPNPVANFTIKYPDAVYFYILVVYNFHICGLGDIIWSDVPVAIWLSSFTARPGLQQVVLEWTTESERDHLGFHLARKGPGDENFQIITKQLIPSAEGGNTPSAHRYRYVDGEVLSGVRYHYQLRDISFDGHTTLRGTVAATPLLADELPGEFRLFQNYPNPFNGTAHIRYRLPACAAVTVKMYDVRGELVRILADGFLESGEHAVDWDGKTATGQPVSSGLYFCSLTAGERQEVMKMVLLR